MTTKPPPPTHTSKHFLDKKLNNFSKFLLGLKQDSTLIKLIASELYIPYQVQMMHTEQKDE